jgi:hypothetical protein
MWRSINTSVPRAFDARRSVSTYQGDLLSGAMLFNKKFTAQWAADGYRYVAVIVRHECVCVCMAMTHRYDLMPLLPLLSLAPLVRCSLSVCQ